MNKVSSPVKHKRRYCKVEGCTRIVKSQGLCQSHGAKPCKCKIPGCLKQAQGGFNGMCKVHARKYSPVEGPRKETSTINPREHEHDKDVKPILPTPVSTALASPQVIDKTGIPSRSIVSDTTDMSSDEVASYSSSSGCWIEDNGSSSNSKRKQHGVTTTAAASRKRLCRVPGCPRVIKSNGTCQRHGAVPVKCKVTACSSQAQGNCRGMCKRHFRCAFPPPATTAATTTMKQSSDRVGIIAKNNQPKQTLVCQVPSTRDVTTQNDNTHRAQHSEMEDSSLKDWWGDPLLSASKSKNEELSADLLRLDSTATQKPGDCKRPRAAGTVVGFQPLAPPPVLAKKMDHVAQKQQRQPSDMLFFDQGNAPLADDDENDVDILQSICDFLDV